MMRMGVTILGIPETVWKTIPRDRPLEAVALDAEGAARRIRKGVNERLENTRFRQLCSYIETTALALAMASGGRYADDRQFSGVSMTEVRVLELSDSGDCTPARTYLNGLELLASHQAPGDDPAASCRSIFPPGEAVNRHLLMLESLLEDEKSLRELAIPPTSEGAATLIIEEVKTLFASSVTAGHAVVQVTNLLPV